MYTNPNAGYLIFDRNVPKFSWCPFLNILIGTRPDYTDDMLKESQNVVFTVYAQMHVRDPTTHTVPSPAPRKKRTKMAHVATICEDDSLTFFSVIYRLCECICTLGKRKHFWRHTLKRVYSARVMRLKEAISVSHSLLQNLFTMSRWEVSFCNKSMLFF